MPTSSPNPLQVAVYMNTPSAFVGVGINAAPINIACELSSTYGAGGALAVTLPAIQAYLWGTQNVSGVLNVTLPAIRAELFPAGELNITLPGIIAELTGLRGSAGYIDVLLPAISAQLNGGGNLSVVLPGITAALIGTTETLGILTVALPGISAALSGYRSSVGEINVVLPTLLAALAGQRSHRGEINVTLPILRARMTGVSGMVCSLDVELPALRAQLTGLENRIGAINVTLPAITAELLGPTLLRGLPKAYGVVENTRNFANSTYENGFQFNSIILFNGEYIGCNNGGLFLIGGKFDNGQIIDARLKIPPFDYGKDVYNFVRDVWMTLRNDGPIKVTVEPDEGDTYSYQTLKVDENVHEERVKLGRGLKPRYYGFTIENIMGARFTLDAIDFLGEPAVQRKR